MELISISSSHCNISSLCIHIHAPPPSVYLPKEGLAIFVFWMGSDYEKYGARARARAREVRKIHYEKYILKMHMCVFRNDDSARTKQMLEKTRPSFRAGA